MAKKSKLTKRVIKPIPIKKVNKFLADLLICHGKDLDIVEDLINLGLSIGLNTSNVQKLPSRQMLQDEKVDYTINNSNIVLVLVSFNEDEPNSLNARPNVYDELTRAIKKGKKNVIVLREKKDNGALINLPSNLEGKCVIIEFKRTILQKMYPELLKELRSRINLGFEENEVTKKIRSGDILNKFLEQMDDIWEKQLDIASDYIVKEWETEYKFKELLDKFFQAYHKVFEALIKHKTDEENLKPLIFEKLSESKKIALDAWKVVTEGKLKYVEEIIKNNKGKDFVDKKRKIDNAFALMRKTKKAASIEEKIKDYREALDELSGCL